MMKHKVQFLFLVITSDRKTPLCRITILVNIIIVIIILTASRCNFLLYIYALSALKKSSTYVTRSSLGVGWDRGTPAWREGILPTSMGMYVAVCMLVYIYLCSSIYHGESLKRNRSHRTYLPRIFPC